MPSRYSVKQPPSEPKRFVPCAGRRKRATFPVLRPLLFAALGFDGGPRTKTERISRVFAVKRVAHRPVMQIVSALGCSGRPARLLTLGLRVTYISDCKRCAHEKFVSARNCCTRGCRSRESHLLTTGLGTEWRSVDSMRVRRSVRILDCGPPRLFKRRSSLSLTFRMPGTLCQARASSPRARSALPCPECAVSRIRRVIGRRAVVLAICSTTAHTWLRRA